MVTKNKHEVLKYIRVCKALHPHLENSSVNGTKHHPPRNSLNVSSTLELLLRDHDIISTSLGKEKAVIGLILVSVLYLRGYDGGNR